MWKLHNLRRRRYPRPPASAQGASGRSSPWQYQQGATEQLRCRNDQPCFRPAQEHEALLRMAMAVQDCWRVCDRHGEQDAVRCLLRQMTVRPVELAQNREAVAFCGMSLQWTAPPRSLKPAPKRCVDNAKGMSFLIRRKSRKPPCAPPRLRCSSCRRPSALPQLPAADCCQGCDEGLELAGIGVRHLAALLFAGETGQGRHDAPSACLPKPAGWPAAACAGAVFAATLRPSLFASLEPAPGPPQAERNADAGHDWQDWTAIGGAGLFVTAFAATRLKSGFPEGNCDVGTASSWPHNQKSPCRKSLQGLSRSLEPTERLELSTC